MSLKFPRRAKREKKEGDSRRAAIKISCQWEGEGWRRVRWITLYQDARVADRRAQSVAYAGSSCIDLAATLVTDTLLLLDL